MSIEEQQRTIGKLVLEHRDAKHELGLLRTRLRGVGHSLYTIAHQLSQDQFEIAGKNLASFHDEDVDVSAIAALLQEHAEAERRVEDLAGQMAGLGLKP